MQCECLGALLAVGGFKHKDASLLKEALTPQREVMVLQHDYGLQCRGEELGDSGREPGPAGTLCYTLWQNSKDSHTEQRVTSLSD